MKCVGHNWKYQVKWSDPGKPKHKFDYTIFVQNSKR